MTERELALTVACPVCAQQPGQMCRMGIEGDWTYVPTPHAERILLAQSSKAILAGGDTDAAPTEEAFDAAVLADRELF